MKKSLPTREEMLKLVNNIPPGYKLIVTPDLEFLYVEDHRPLMFGKPGDGLLFTEEE